MPGTTPGPVHTKVYGPAGPLITRVIDPSLDAQVLGCTIVGVIIGVGLTNTVAAIGVPGQPLAVGVIVNVTVIGAPVVLVSDPLISPDPLAAMPVTVALLSLVHAKLVPTTGPVSAIVVIALPEQIV